MSDEPLFCPLCGDEIGPDHRNCGFDFEADVPREKRHCEVCGVIPRDGFECHFYQRGGNREGCRS